MKKSFKILTLIFLVIGMACSSSDSEENLVPKQNPTPDPIPTPSGSTDIKIVYDEFEGRSIMVVGNASLNFMVAFYPTSVEKKNNFSAVQDSLPIVMKDKEGSYWNIFGKALNGPNVGKQLSSPTSFVGYWFSWGAFYPGLKIFDNNLSRPNTGQSVSGSDGWSIPRKNVHVGASKEAIPSIDNPDFIQITNSMTSDPSNPMNSKELVVMINVNGSIHVYPHNILNWHEIVNDEINNSKFALVFCPLTGTSTVWDRNINGGNSTFGVSGFLYNSNVVPYDRVSGSNWSQMLLKSVNGSLEGTNSKNIFSIETTYATARIISDNFQQMTTDTGHSRNYAQNPYGNYPVNSSIMFPVNFNDNRLHAKERVLGVIINGKAKAYRFTSF